MKLRVLFFSILRDITESGELEESFDADAAPATVADLLDDLCRRWPELAAWRGRLLVAVDMEFATPDTPLHDGAEVAVMPPVQGG